MAELVREVPGCVLAVYAHPDDSDVSCGGSLAKWASLGSRVHLVVCTDGDKGSVDPNTDVAELIKTRRAEVASSAKLLDLASVSHLGHLDGEIENDLVLRGEIVRLIRSIRPDVLVCPDPLAVFFGEHYFNHRDHRIIGWAALDAVAPAASSPLYFPEEGNPFSVGVVYLSGSLEANVFVDITETIDLKADAVLCHETQLGEAGESMRPLFYERAEQAGRVAGVAFAEAFRRVRLGH